MSKTIRVTAPYVTLKVLDPINGPTVRGFYDGAVVENVDDASAQHHVDTGMAVPADADSTPAAHPEEPAEPPTPPLEEPAGNASTEAWLEYARSKGASEEDLVDEDGKPLTRDALRDKFGTPAGS